MTNTLPLTGLTSRERTEEIMKILEKGVRDVFSSNKYATFLSLMSRFHHYSYRNTILIMMQMPEATRVAGVGIWNRLGRTVIKGSHGIRIIAPATYSQDVWVDLLDALGKPVVNPDTGKTLQIRRSVEISCFKPVFVFDQSQTSGDPLPELVSDLMGDLDDSDAMLDAIRSISGCPVLIQPLKGKAKGHYSLTDHQIVIRAGMSPVHTVKTAIHELAHARLHDPVNQPKRTDKTVPLQKDRRTAECVAESISFVVLQHYGIDTSDYSFSYVAAWSSNEQLQELHQSLLIIQAEASRIIDELDLAMKPLPFSMQSEPLAVLAC